MCFPHRLCLLLVVLQATCVRQASSFASSAVPHPTAADFRFDAWCDANSIYRVGVQTVTTPLSLGGRGLFATRDLPKGSVVASIPANLVIVQEGDEEWQISLTNQVMGLKDDTSNEWIQSWKGCGALDIETLLNNPDNQDTMKKFVGSIAGQGAITHNGAKKELTERLENYSKRLGSLSAEEDTSKWYSLVLSRSAYLGKEWGFKAGAVPFFDMLNHCHDARSANTELVTFGSCLDKTKESSNEADSSGLQRKDMLLVLTKDVNEGQELLTQYEKAVTSEEGQLKLWIQYGIPPP
ncbi:expressed unknown protein [Seminavis robusta]|uniref:SET domain-containing protein n=1 Tax=Seminavis robusta TaxID=568900 RepID=A0A9N8HSZ1_9STRA|nr:expressed unknown protein [Seminavis robusta]|eukprot:Sro1797_g298140.1 n/a (295) ;mRNA; f:3081-3965